MVLAQVKRGMLGGRRKHLEHLILEARNNSVGDKRCEDTEALGLDF